MNAVRATDDGDNRYDRLKVHYNGAGPLYQVYDKEVTQSQPAETIHHHWYVAIINLWWICVAQRIIVFSRHFRPQGSLLIGRLIFCFSSRRAVHCGGPCDESAISPQSIQHSTALEASGKSIPFQQISKSIVRLDEYLVTAACPPDELFLYAPPADRGCRCEAVLLNVKCSSKSLSVVFICERTLINLRLICQVICTWTIS